LARKVKVEVQGRLAQRGIRVTIVNKNIGYELRCADPIPFDAAYCRDLGYSAIRFLLEGGTEAMISVQGGRMVPMPFDAIRESGTGKTRVRMVNIESEGYRVAREYMIRLEAKDFDDASWVQKLAAAANMNTDEFRSRFGYFSGQVL
jgi:6-phosphofructokinase 1